MKNEAGQLAIGIDVGGTWTRVAVVDRGGCVRACRSRETSRFDTRDGLLGWLVEAAGELRHEVECGPSEALPVGLAIAGTLDDDRTTVLRSVNLPTLEGCRVADELAARIGSRVAVFTDAEASTWAEYQVRTPRPERFVHLRIGTGIACGVVTDGQLQRLDAGRTKHLDVLVVDDGPDAPQCVCGRRGCVEAVASGAALEQRAVDLGYDGGLVELADAYGQGDARAIAVVRRAAGALAVAIENLVRRFDASVISIGGGVTEGLPQLLELPAGSETRLMARAAHPVSTRLERARLGDDSGTIGGACLVIALADGAGNGALTCLCDLQ